MRWTEEEELDDGAKFSIYLRMPLDGTVMIMAKDFAFDLIELTSLFGYSLHLLLPFLQWKLSKYHLILYKIVI